MIEIKVSGEELFGMTRFEIHGDDIGDDYTSRIPAMLYQAIVEYTCKKLDIDTMEVSKRLFKNQVTYFRRKGMSNDAIHNLVDMPYYKLYKPNTSVKH